MAYTDDWENLMNGVFGAGGRPRFGGTAQPEAKPQKSGTSAVPDLNAALLENQKQLDALLKKQNAQLKTQDDCGAVCSGGQPPDAAGYGSGRPACQGHCRCDRRAPGQL
ncbi:MAG: hypothetical protein ACLUSW_08875 [Faecalibacterium sp.]